MINAIFEALAQSVQGIFQIIINAFLGTETEYGAVDVFYNSTTDELTLIGVLLLLSVGIGMSYAALRWVKSLMPR